MGILMFFVVVPAAASLVQMLLVRSRLPRGVKCVPAVLTAAVGLVCLGGMTRVLPLPDTYYFDRGSFLAFPDYWYVGLFCLPVLMGLGIGAILSTAIPEKEGSQKADDDS